MEVEILMNGLRVIAIELAIMTGFLFAIWVTLCLKH